MSLPSAASSASAHRPPQRPKSPPLAFQPTSNDALVSASTYGDSLASPPVSAMGQISPLSPPSHERQLQAIINQQNSALRKARESFDEERKAWDLERQHLQERIARLEQHIKPGDHWSPAKSPVLSPSSHPTITSPSARASINPSLPTIAEDENFQPLSARRHNAPGSIDLPAVPALTRDDARRKSSVSFDTANGLLVEEFSVTPPRAELSPPPPNNRVLAGHTPVRAPQRPPTPPPREMSMDGIEDTPTRRNTHINTYLTQSSDEEDDRELRGPLMMPELPHQPDSTNFTLEALSKKLEHIQEHPEDGKPMVFSEPSPGLASPVSEKEEDLSPRSQSRAMGTEAPFAPVSSRATEIPGSERSSNALSPTASNGGVMSPQEVHEAKVQAEFEQGGIKLKKKSSVNFGAPFGSLSFPAARKPSHE